jgi:hypothetical protein
MIPGKRNIAAASDHNVSAPPKKPPKRSNDDLAIDEHLFDIRSIQEYSMPSSTLFFMTAAKRGPRP